MDVIQAIKTIGEDTPLWGYAYEMSNPLDDSRRKQHQKPIKGVITKKSKDGKVSQFAAYKFIPLKKDMTLSWSRSIDASSRRYAVTQEEAIDAYNKRIFEFSEKLQEIRKQLITEQLDGGLKKKYCLTDTADSSSVSKTKMIR